MKESQPKYVINLLFAVAKAVSEPRINCFEVASSASQKTLVLQAESQEDRDEWLAAMQNTTAELLNACAPSPAKPSITLSPSSATTSTGDQTTPVQFARQITGNRICADCSMPGMTNI